VPCFHVIESTEMVIMPMIDTAADVKRMISNMKYPPMGNRSFGTTNFPLVTMALYCITRLTRFSWLCACVCACVFVPVFLSPGPMRVSELLGLSHEQYRTHANANTICLAMIETRTALDNLDEILAIPGCDGVFVGPADLSISLSNGGECNMNAAGVMVPSLFSRHSSVITIIIYDSLCLCHIWCASIVRYEFVPTRKP
jgi:hypothetical protein